MGSGPCLEIPLSPPTVDCISPKRETKLKLIKEDLLAIPHHHKHKKMKDSPRRLSPRKKSHSQKCMNAVRASSYTEEEFDTPHQLGPQSVTSRGAKHTPGLPGLVSSEPMEKLKFPSRKKPTLKTLIKKCNVVQSPRRHKK